MKTTGLEPKDRIQAKFYHDTGKSNYFNGTIQKVKYDVLFDDGEFLENVSLDRCDFENRSSEDEWRIITHTKNNNWSWTICMSLLVIGLNAYYFSKYNM